jgi:hypothetical protein
MSKKQKTIEQVAPARKPYRIAWSVKTRSCICYRAGADEYSSKSFNTLKEAEEYAKQQNEAFSVKGNGKRRG